MRPSSFRLILKTLIVSALSITIACSDDSVAPQNHRDAIAPLGYLALPTGFYRTTIVAKACGSPDSNVITYQHSVCAPDTLYALPLDFPCNLLVDGDRLSLNCTTTTDVGGGCLVRTHITATGRKSDETWHIQGQTLEIGMSPPECAPSLSCEEFRVTIEQITPGPPDDCHEADPGTIQGTLTGGPAAGDIDLPASGTGTPGAAGLSWSVNGVLEEPGDVNLILSFIAPEASPLDLPVEIPILVVSSGAFRRATSQGVATITYSESRVDPAHGFVADGGGGTVTLLEVTANHVTGILYLDLTGIENGTTRSARTIDAAFHVGERRGGGDGWDRMPVDDAWMTDGAGTPRDGIPDTVENGRDYVQVAGNLDWESRAFWEFDLAALGTQISRATLTLYFDVWSGTDLPVMCTMDSYAGDGFVGPTDWDAGTSLFLFSYNRQDSMTFNVTDVVEERLQAGDRYIGFAALLSEDCVPSIMCPGFIIHSIEGDISPPLLRVTGP